MADKVWLEMKSIAKIHAIEEARLLGIISPEDVVSDVMLEPNEDGDWQVVFLLEFRW